MPPSDGTTCPWGCPTSSGTGGLTGAQFLALQQELRDAKCGLAHVTGRLDEVKSAGRFAGQSDIIMSLTRLSVNGRSYALQTNQYSRKGSSRGKATAAKVGGGAAVGAILGGLLGGGKGAAIGATVGAGAGTGVSAATKGQQIVLPSETVLNFQLQAPVSVIPSSTGPNAGRQTLN